MRLYLIGHGFISAESNFVLPSNVSIVFYTNENQSTGGNIFTYGYSFHESHLANSLEDRMAELGSKLIIKNSQTKQILSQGFNPIVYKGGDSVSEHELHRIGSFQVFQSTLNFPFDKNKTLYKKDGDPIRLSQIIEKYKNEKEGLEIHWLCCRQKKGQASELYVTTNSTLLWDPLYLKKDKLINLAANIFSSIGSFWSGEPDYVELYYKSLNHIEKNYAGLTMEEIIFMGKQDEFIKSLEAFDNILHLLPVDKVNIDVMKDIKIWCKEVQHAIKTATEFFEQKFYLNY